MPSGPDTPVIKMKNVSKYFGDFQALRTCSLDVALGERVVVCGPSGSGKSTLIRCINRLEKHEAGDIEVDGVQLNDSSAALDAVRKNVGMVFQQFNLFPHLTVLENLTLGPRRAYGLSEADANARANPAVCDGHFVLCGGRPAGGPARPVRAARGAQREPGLRGMRARCTDTGADLVGLLWPTHADGIDLERVLGGGFGACVVRQRISGGDFPRRHPVDCARTI